MPAISSNNGTLICFGDSVDDCAQIAVERSWLDQIHGSCQAIKGRLDKTFAVVVDSPYHVGLIQIRVKSASIVDGNVQVDNVYWLPKIRSKILIMVSETRKLH